MKYVYFPAEEYCLRLPQREGETTMFTPIFTSRNPLGALERNFDRALLSLLAPQYRPTDSPQSRGTACGTPPTNIWENDEVFILEAELPGVKAEDLEILVVANELTLRGERKRSAEENMKARHREIDAGKFTRVLQFPCELNSERVEASLKDGVLKLTLPKHPAAKARKIAVTTSH
jgi:HSP20 family protein